MSGKDINDILSQATCAAVASALDGPGLTETLVKQLLNTKVNEAGNFYEGRYGQREDDFKLTLIEYYMHQAVKGVVKEEVGKLINERREDIRAAIVKSLNDEDNMTMFTDSFIEAIRNALDKDYYWDSKINVTFGRSEKEVE